MYEDNSMLSWPAPVPVEPPTARYKLVAVDLDTILQPDGTLHPVDVAALRTAHAFGVKVVLVSAKPPQALHRYWAQLGLSTPVIALNGALVYDYPSHSPLSGQAIEAESERFIVQAVQRISPTASIGLEFGDSWATNRIGPVARAIIKQTGVWPRQTGDLRSLMDEPVYQLWISALPEQLDMLQNELATHGLAMQRHTNPDLLAVSSAAASRGTALASVADTLQIVPDEVMAVGDSGRDRSFDQAAAFIVHVPQMGIEPELSVGGAREIAQSQGVAEALARYLVPEGGDGIIWPSAER